MKCQEFSKFGVFISLLLVIMLDSNKILSEGSVKTYTSTTCIKEHHIDIKWWRGCLLAI